MYQNANLYDYRYMGSECVLQRVFLDVCVDV